MIDPTGARDMIGMNAHQEDDVIDDDRSTVQQ
jgi:hypothetical protein